MIVVTGANGLVGSHLITTLLAQDKQVKAMYHTVHADIHHQNLIWQQGDILDITALEEIFMGVTQVYHCAAIVSFNPKDKQLLRKTNVEGTANVVNACLSAGVQKLLYVSSVATLGRASNSKLISETNKWIDGNHNSEYAKSKYLAEMEVWRGIGEGLEAVIINPSIILGCSDWTKGSAAIFKNAYKEFPWFTNGSNGFVDVQDVATIMTKLMDSHVNAQRFVVSGYNLSYQALFTSIANAFRKKPPHKLVTPFLAEIIWRLEALKAKFSSSKPLLTKETARTAQQIISYNNSKLLNALPDFKYKAMNNSIERICKELKAQYQLS
jgi:nucleoside-diphosphate-sugar epimerase